MRSEGDGNPVYETPVYDNNRNPRENLEQNVEIADKPGPKPCPALGKTCFACGKQNDFSSVCRSARKTPRGIPRPPEQNPKREHLHQVDQYDSSDELSEENEEYVYSTTTIKVQNPTLPDESVSVISQPSVAHR